jgi:hypothetical protein
MIKNLAASAALLLAVACSSTPMSSNESGGASVAGLATSSAAASDYILLSSPTSVRQYNAIEPVYGLHLKGTMTNRGFVPAGSIEGRGKLCQGNDWLSLSDLRIHKASEGTPSGAHILGCANGTSFTPASREVTQ